MTQRADESGDAKPDGDIVARAPMAVKNNDAPLAVTTVMLAVIIGIALALDAMVLLVFMDRVDVPQFLALTTLVAGIACAGVFLPNAVGHALAVVVGAACVAGGGAAFYKGMTPVLPVTLVLTGALLAVLAAKSWKGNRAAWSFLVATLAVMFVCLFFGAPKVRGTVGIDIWLALIMPGLLATATVSLAVSHERYATRQPAI